MNVSPHFEVFLAGGVFHAPYGPRIASQLPKVAERLIADNYTRKAHVNVWDALQDLYTDDTRDHPCTTSMQFMIRDGRLDLHVHMRANDAWRGFPYDVFQFTQLQQAMAAFLRRDVGHYYHNATSFHVYSVNYDAAEELTASEQEPITGVTAKNAGHWKHVQRRARDLFYGTASFMGPGEALMSDALRRRGVTGAW
jgi:thymidylate synthase